VILDSHCHIIPAGMLTDAVPDQWRPALGQAGGRRVVTFRGRTLTSVTGEFADARAMLAEAEAAGVTHLLLSPWILLVPAEAEPEAAARICRVQNDSLARAAADCPASRLDGHYLWNSVGNPVETAIAAAPLVTGGVLERSPGLTVLLAHGGGALPALRGRLRRAFAVRPEARADCAAGPDEMLGRLYYDSLTHDRAVLAGLVEFAGAEHVLLGSDRPFDLGSEHPVRDVTELNLNPDHEQLILGGNAARLLATGR
jgi:Amidohydrolase